MQRQVALNRLESNTETVDWMNHFLDRFWLIFEPVLSAQVIGQMDAILSENTPSFLDSIRLSSFTLGTKAPRINSIKIYQGSDPDIVVCILSLIRREYSAHDSTSLVFGLEPFFYTK